MMTATFQPMVVYIECDIVTMSKKEKKSYINLIYPCASAFFHLIETDSVLQAHFERLLQAGLQGVAQYHSNQKQRSKEERDAEKWSEDVFPAWKP